LKKNSCFLPFFGEKYQKCQQKAAKCLIMSYSTCPASKVLNFNVFDDFKFSVKSKMAANMAAILNDATGPKQRGTPKYKPHPVEYTTGFLLKVKSFQNIVI